MLRPLEEASEAKLLTVRPFLGLDSECKKYICISL